MRVLNLTKQRQAILDVVKGATDHPTATDVMDKLTATGNRFAYATIYNSLKYLSENGLVRELNLGNGVTRYDGRLEDHYHVVCQQCGAITEAESDKSFALTQEMELNTGYKIFDVSIHFEGICPACQG